MGQLVGFLLHLPLSEIAKKLGKMLKYTPPPLSKCFRHRCIRITASIFDCTLYSVHYTMYNVICTIKYVYKVYAMSKATKMQTL